MTENSNVGCYNDWLDNSIVEGHIKYYEYSDFTNTESIGKGSYGNVVRVNWKNSRHFYVLKIFNNDKQTLEEVVKELKMHRSVDDHENIIRLYGVTMIKDAVYQMNKYSLVLEYANNGTLNAYLKEHFYLGWGDKYRLALQLASAVDFLHKKNIIHRDLHANNILVHQNNIKLADFGLSKKIAEVSSKASQIIGAVPYIDPYKFRNSSYKLNKKSDVYSVGILMWQISSGREPFKDYDYDACLLLLILDGRREEMIDGTPVKYNELYTECWKYEPNERPNMQEVVSVLETIISSEQNAIIICKVDEKKELERQMSNSNKGTIDTNNDLVIESSLNIDKTQDSNSSMQNDILEQKVASSTSISTNNDVDYSQEFRVKSIFNYAGGADDLKFDTGIVFVAHPSKNPDNVELWYGSIEETGSKGWFPKNFVEIYKEEKEICKVKALYDYKALNSTELDIKAGDIVSILDKSLNDRWKAEFEGSKGFVPAIYVEEITSSSG